MRRLWQRRKLSAFPPGAVTFHLDTWTRRSLSPEGAAAAARVRERFEFAELLLLHGSAWVHGGAWSLVAGPPGIGKSTALRDLERHGHGRVEEDAIVLVGVKPSGWYAVSTGSTDVLERASRISRRIRDMARADFSLWQNADAGALRRRHPLRTLLFDHVSQLSFTLAAAFGPRPEKGFTPSIHAVQGLVHLSHPQDPCRALHLRGGGAVEEAMDLAALAPPSVALTSLSPLGDRTLVGDRLRRALLRGEEQESRERRSG